MPDKSNFQILLDHLRGMEKRLIAKIEAIGKTPTKNELRTPFRGSTSPEGGVNKDGQLKRWVDPDAGEEMAKPGAFDHLTKGK